jgi:DivIVA domain-containing protein
MSGGAAVLGWAEAVVMAKMTPEQEARYALKWNVSRSDLTTAAQHEYDRLKAGQGQKAAAAWEAATAAYEAARATGRVPGSYAPPMNGDDIRRARFWRNQGNQCYDSSEVDDLLHRLAAELDSGQPVGPVIRSARFRRARGYDIDAVDWFLEQLLRSLEDAEQAGISADPWHDLAVVNQFSCSGPGELADRSAKTSWRTDRQYRAADRKYFAEDCSNAWRDFGLLRGVRLYWVRGELRTAERQTIASVRAVWSTTVSVGGRKLTLKPMRRARYPDSVIVEIAARSVRDSYGHFAAETPGQLARLRQQPGARWKPGVGGLAALGDATGTPILYTSGQNFVGRAKACISFSDQRCLRFLVRGTKEANAIMTAVDQAGNRVARYRLNSEAQEVEIIVNPRRALSDELVLAIAISAPWLGSYFQAPVVGDDPVGVAECRLLRPVFRDSHLANGQACFCQSRTRQV